MKDILSESGHCWSGIPTGGSGHVVNLSSRELLVLMGSVTLFSVKAMYDFTEKIGRCVMKIALTCFKVFHIFHKRAFFKKDTVLPTLLPIFIVLSMKIIF